MYPIFHIFHPIQDQEDLTKIRRNNLRMIIGTFFNVTYFANIFISIDKIIPENSVTKTQ